MNILILYTTLEGQTAKIAGQIANNLRQKHHHVVTQAGDHLPGDFEPETYDAAIIGGPIHMGRYPRAMKKFVMQHNDWLNKNPSALFTVCMAINSQSPESRQQAINYAEKFITETQWNPAKMVIFAGAVKYTQYGLITRYIMKRISKSEGGSTDTSQDHEYTDWDDVKNFSLRFAEILEAAQADEVEISR